MSYLKLKIVLSHSLGQKENNTLFLNRIAMFLIYSSDIFLQTGSVSWART
jgi:hypothetical protein